MFENPVGLIEQALKNKDYKLNDIKDKAKRNIILEELEENTSISGRELARIHGISKDIISRA